MKSQYLKTMDMFIYSLLIVSALNWGIVGLFGFNLVTFLLGDATLLSRAAFSIVGLAAAYDLVFIKAIWGRWNIHFKEGVTA